MKTQILQGLILVVRTVGVAGHAYSQSFENGYFRLTTQWLGEGKALDVVNDGSNSKVYLNVAGNATGQFWKITATEDGYYRLTTKWLGEGRSLDVVNDGTNSKLRLAESSAATGQLWKITPLGNGFYRLTTKWLGDGRSLDVVNDGQDRELKLADTSKAGGQFWKITSVSGNTAVTKGWEGQKRKELIFSGFKVIVGADFAEQAEVKQALDLLSDNLATIVKIVKPAHLAKLKTIPIWVQYRYKEDGALWYHTSKEWLLANGYPAEMENAVEISNIENFLHEKDNQPLQVLHELAHGFQDQFIPDLQDELQAAYDNAVASSKYDSVERVGEGKVRAYALTDITEYFAELTEAYFGENDYYPFNREQLKAFDPKGYKLMQDAWE
jgi:hypothetical protein